MIQYRNIRLTHRNRHGIRYTDAGLRILRKVAGLTRQGFVVGCSVTTDAEGHAVLNATAVPDTYPQPDRAPIRPEEFG